MRWDQENIPHKGWTEIGMEDLGENTEFGEEIMYEECQMCGNERIRYVHIMTHPKVNREFRVGCICASKMADDYVNPQKKERDLKNRVKRKQNFMRKEWKLNPRTGNMVLKYKGEHITIMKSKYGSGWGVIYAGNSIWEYNGKKIRDFETAKLVAFNLFDEEYNSKHEAQPHWDQGRWMYY